MSNTNPYSPPESTDERTTASPNTNELFIQVRQTWVKLGTAIHYKETKTWHVGIEQIDPLAWKLICYAFKHDNAVRIKVNGRVIARSVEVNRGANDEYLMWFMV